MTAVPVHMGEALSFLGTWLGQLTLAAGSVVFLVIAKGFTRRPGDHDNGNRPLQWDDLAIGLDLLVLAIVTLIAYGGSQYKAEVIARAENNSEAVALAQNHQDDAFRLALVAFFLFVSVTWMIQWWGQYSKSERRKHKRNLFHRIKSVRLVPDGEGDRGDADVIDLALDVREAPRFKLVFGHLIPTALGLLMLLFAIRAATQ